MATTDLSHPSSSSVNDGIPSQLYAPPLHVTIDDAILSILRSGRNTMLVKIAIKSAFHLLPVHPVDQHILGMRWRDQIYIGYYIPFSLQSALKLFNIFADLLAWLLRVLVFPTSSII